MPAIINLPFPGFYESELSYGLDREEEQWCEWQGEGDQEGRFAPELRITQNELAELVFECAHYSEGYRYLAEQYCAQFENDASEALGFTLGLEFESMESPRYYNFETDRVFAFIPARSIGKLFRMSRKEGHETLKRVIRERFTSYDGFLSHYPNGLDAWLSKRLRDWDHNELGTLLLACLSIAGFPPREIEREVIDHLYEGNDFYDAFDKAVDWRKLEAKREELRADKVAELQEQDPSYTPPEPRCEYTLDLFGGR